MAQLVLFHSALGLRPAVHRFADALRADGHTVHTPDLYEGRTFDTVEEGVAERDRIGVPELSSRAAASVEGLPSDVFYLGFSMGAASAEYLALTRPGCRGLVMMHAALPIQAMGVSTWPGFRAQVHYAESDPWMDGLDDFIAAAPELIEVHRYPGSGHLFADDEHPDFDAASAETMIAAVRAFVGS